MLQSGFLLEPLCRLLHPTNSTNINSNTWKLFQRNLVLWLRWEGNKWRVEYQFKQCSDYRWISWPKFIELTNLFENYFSVQVKPLIKLQLSCFNPSVFCSDLLCFTKRVFKHAFSRGLTRFILLLKVPRTNSYIQIRLYSVISAFIGMTFQLFIISTSYNNMFCFHEHFQGELNSQLNSQLINELE